MESKQQDIVVPRFYRPWPHQLKFWNAVDNGHPEYGVPDYTFALWSRQSGKDVSCQQRLLYTGFSQPGQQHVYVGLDNVWVRDNIFKKYMDGRTFWDDYPQEIIEHKDTVREVYFHNNPSGTAPTRIKYVGLLNEKGVIGSSYRDWMISETSLYPRDAFKYIMPIWQMKKAQGEQLQVIFNGTPRGMGNVYFDLFKQFTGKDDPADFPGWHKTEYGTCFVSKVTIEDILIPDKGALGSYRPLYTPEQISRLRADYVRVFGNDNLFRQEYFCDFLTVNAGVIYQAWSQVLEDGRFTKVNRDPNHPVYITMDLGSKGKFTDATAAILWQRYAGVTKVLNVYEFRGLALTEALGQIAAHSKDFPFVSYCSLPWDVTRGYTEEDAMTQAQQRYPSIRFDSLPITKAVSQDIVNAQMLLPNLWVNDSKDEMDVLGFHTGGEWFDKCIQNYQYRRINSLEDWGAPKHDWSSHLMDAFRYMAATIKKSEFANEDLSGKKKPKTRYKSIFDEDRPIREKSPIYMSEAERKEHAERTRRQQAGYLDDARKRPWVF